MKERSKERYAALLMEELLEQIAERERIRSLLGEMITMPVEELIRLVLDDFEKILEHRLIETGGVPMREEKGEVVLESEQERPKTKTRRAAAGDSAKSGEVDAKTVAGAKRLVEEASAALEAIRKSDADMETRDSRLDELLKTINDRLEELPRQEDSGTSSPVFPKREADEDPPPVRPQPVEHHKHRLPKIPYAFAEDDSVYLHGVMMIPRDDRFDSPFMLEEKGIDQRNFAFALDHGDLRVYLSKFSTAQMAISKNGMLLLGKPESLGVRGTHVNIVNDLRVRGTVLPFAFGTVAHNRSELMSLLKERHDDIRAELDELAKTTWWTVSLFVLDARIAEVFGETSQASGRTRERQRESLTKLPPVKKHDIKVLERVLQKEKKIAEVVHRELEQIAERADVDSMVGMMSGASDEWKLILRSSYEVPPERWGSYFRKVTELQYDHILFDLMLDIEGAVGSFQLRAT